MEGISLSNRLKHGAYSLFLAAMALSISAQPVFADEPPMVINSNDGSLFMEEVETPKQKKPPERPKPVIDLSTVGVPVDQQGRIVPLIDRSSPVQQQYSKLSAYNEPWYNFLPQQYVNPYGYRFNAMGQTVDAFGRPVTATGQALYPNSLSPNLNAYMPPIGVRNPWIAPNGMPSGVPLMNAPGTSPNSTIPQSNPYLGMSSPYGYGMGTPYYGYSPFGSMYGSGFPYGYGGTNIGINLGKNFQLNLGSSGTPYVQPNLLFGNPAAGLYPPYGGGLFGLPTIRQFESTSTITPLYP